MARPLRIEFPGAIYHAVARGNARQRIFRKDADYQRLTAGLEATVDKFGFEIFSFVWMPNHIHLFFRTPRPNLSRGMQYLLSGYANWFNSRHNRTGHLFQGRFKGELIEDEYHFWNVSRYLHLNPVRGKRPLVKRPQDWPWSSYQGYFRQRQRVDWISYDAIYQAWLGERGGKDTRQAADAYRRFVARGVADPPTNPLQAAVDGWLLGSRAFVERMKQLAKEPVHADQVPLARRLRALPLDYVLERTADHFDVELAAFQQTRSGLFARDAAAWLARRLTTATLRDLAAEFGLGHPDSVTNLTRRAEQAMRDRPKLKKQVDALRRQLLETRERE